MSPDDLNKAVKERAKLQTALKKIRRSVNSAKDPSVKEAEIKSAIREVDYLIPN